MWWNRIYNEATPFSSLVPLYYTELVKPSMYVLGIQTQQPGSVRSVLHVAMVGLFSRSTSTSSMRLSYFLLSSFFLFFCLCLSLFIVSSWARICTTLVASVYMCVLED